MTDSSSDIDSAPFGAMDRSDLPKGEGAAKTGDKRTDWRKKGRGRGRGRDRKPKEAGELGAEGNKEPGRQASPEGEKKPGRQRQRQKPKDGEQRPQEGEPKSKGGEQKPEGERRQRRSRGRGGDKQQDGQKRGQSRGEGRGQQRRGGGGDKPKRGGDKPKRDGGSKREPKPAREPIGTIEGLILIDKQKHGDLRASDKGWVKTNADVHVLPHLIQKYKLTEGMLIKGPFGKGQGRAKFDLIDVETIDGMEPSKLPKTRPFKTFTSVAPDFHYNVGDLSGDLSLRIVDLLAPVGRGQRGLLVAPPRSGKTMIMQSFAKAIEDHFPDVTLMVLLIDERPEEATEWRRSIDPSKVFVSTNDETANKHAQLCEAVFKRAKRLVELGEEVVLLIDSLTRMGRAYNNVKGNSGKTMSGGIDSRALEIPKQFFGMARNTESAGSLTILATALIETGSQMDRVIFEEFKGTGNMELVLSRKLADRRIFPAIDVERSGTRKEERLFSLPKLRQMHTLRRVLTRMHFAEAMELLITKLDDVPTNAEFLKRFEVDPEA